MIRLLTAFAVMLLLALPAFAGELDREFAEKPRATPTMVAPSGAATVAALKTTELDQESPAQARRGWGYGGGHYGGWGGHHGGWGSSYGWSGYGWAGYGRSRYGWGGYGWYGPSYAYSYYPAYRYPSYAYYGYPAYSVYSDPSWSLYCY